MENIEDNKMKDTLILAIESSCDETAASVVKNGRTILSNVIADIPRSLKVFPASIVLLLFPSITFSFFFIK